MIPLRGYSGDMNNMPTGTFLCELAKCTNAPPYPMGMWVHVICYANFSQTAIFYNGKNYPPVIATRTYANNAWTAWAEQGVGFGFNDVWQKGTITNGLLVDLNNRSVKQTRQHLLQTGTLELLIYRAIALAELEKFLGLLVRLSWSESRMDS